MEQIEKVDKVKGIPATSAARISATSPSGHNIPAIPVGAIATGIDTGSPASVLASDLFRRSRQTRWRNPIAAKSDTLRSRVLSVQDPLSI
jgi:hypothetical protein